MSVLAVDAQADLVRRARLRRMRTVATALLLLAAVIYLLTLRRDGVLGFVNAAAEASMVGAIADWFAVTALFKRPMGLPIPHTALIPRRKDDLGRGLEAFVRENFLREDVVRARLASVGVSARLGTWLVERDNAVRAVREIATVVGLGLRRVRDDDVAAVVEEVVLPRLKQEPTGPLLGTLMQEIVADGAHQGVVDLVLDEAHRWLVHNQETFSDVVGQRAPWWAPPRVNEVVTERLHLEVVRWLSEIRADPRHDARRALDDALAQLAHDLLDDPDTQARADRLRDRLLDHPQLLATGLALWNALRQALVDALADADGPLRSRLVDELQVLGRRLAGDPELQRRLDARAADLVVFAVERYGTEVTGVITQTIERWDGREASRRIELHVGRDLQFIRINGTLVGGLVGLVIHAVAVVVS